MKPTACLARFLAPLLACALAVCALEATAEAHVVDDYLEAAQITLTLAGPRVELRLTPGTAVVDRVLAEIDRDHDGPPSETRVQAYARHVLGDLSLELDGRPARLAIVDVALPSPDDLREGVEAIRLTLAADAPLDAVGEHRLTFRNDHLPELGSYLVNVLVSDPGAFVVTRQSRDVRQRALTAEFSVASVAGFPPGRILGVGLGVSVALWLVWLVFRRRPGVSLLGARRPRAT